jgi:Family of unknown function (DUF7009)
VKIRMKGNSLRLRVARSELARLREGGEIRETIRFDASPEASFTWALETGRQERATTMVRYSPGCIAVVVAPAAMRLWQRDDQVGIYARVDAGADEPLEVIVEKDFACLDGSDADNTDTFENPNLAATCQAVGIEARADGEAGRAPISTVVGQANVS